MTPLDLGAAPVIVTLVLAPQAARRLKRAGVWTWLMGWLVGLAAVFARRQ